MEIYVISNDGDFRDAINGKDNLTHLSSIGKFIEILLSTESSVINYLHEIFKQDQSKWGSEIENEIMNLNVFVEDADFDAEGYLETATIRDVVEISVIEVKDETAVIEVEIIADLDVYINCYDPDSWYKDPEDKSIHYWDKIEGSFQKEVNLEAQLEIEFQKASIKNYSINNVIVNKGDHISYYVKDYDEYY